MRWACHEGRFLGKALHTPRQVLGMEMSGGGMWMAVEEEEEWFVGGMMMMMMMMMLMLMLMMMMMGHRKLPFPDQMMSV